MSDDELVLGALNDLKSLLGIDAQPIHSVVTRYPRRQPQFEMGHLERIARIEALAAANPDLAVAGNWLTGVGVADCINSARAAVERLIPATG